MNPWPQWAQDDRIGEIEILDHGLQLPAVAFGDLAAEDHRELGRLPIVRLASSRRSPKASRPPPMEDQVVAILDLGKEQAMAAAGASCRSRAEKNGVKLASRFSPQRAISLAVRESARFWSRCGPGFSGRNWCISGTRCPRPQLIGQPVVLVEADTAEKGKYGQSRTNLRPQAQSFT